MLKISNLQRHESEDKQTSDLSWLMNSNMAMEVVSDTSSRLVNGMLQLKPSRWEKLEQLSFARSGQFTWSVVEAWNRAGLKLRLSRADPCNPRPRNHEAWLYQEERPGHWPISKASQYPMIEVWWIIGNWDMTSNGKETRTMLDMAKLSASWSVVVTLKRFL